MRRLGPADASVLEHLADRPPRTTLLDDDAAIFLVAFEDDEPLGFLLAHELPRRHGDAAMLLVYEIAVGEPYRRRHVATSLLRELKALARARGIREAFVLAEPDNDPANALYAAFGGERREVVEWDFTW